MARILGKRLIQIEAPPQISNTPSILSDGLFTILPLNQLGKTFLWIGNEFLPVLNDTRATLSVFSPATMKHPLPWSSKIVQVVKISDEHEEISASEPLPFRLGSLRETLFSLVPLSLPIC